MARRLHNNRFSGDFFGGIYATRLANFLGVPIRGYDVELPPVYLDYEAMVHHRFVERNDRFLRYRLIFDRRRTYHVTLPTPAFFEFQAQGRYVITREEADEYKGRTEMTRLQATSHEAIAAAS